MFYEHINDFAKIAIWHIAEEKNFFLRRVPLQRAITHPHKQLQHLAGRYLLQYLYPDFPYHLIEIADTRKPFLPNEEYHFSISHCGDYAAVIVSKDHRVGIDIELVTSKIERVQQKFLSEKELAAIQPATLNPQLLTLLWSCKEAIFKWYGNGGVDFKKQIRLHTTESGKSPLSSEFTKDKTTALEIHHQYFDGLCLAWVIT